MCVAAAAAKSLQSCLTLCDPIDGSPSGSPVPGILQARTLEWVAISFSNAWKGKVKVKLLSRVRLFVTLWSATCQAPLSMGFSKHGCWSGLPCPPPGDLPNPGTEPASLRSPALASEFAFTTVATWMRFDLMPILEHRLWGHQCMPALWTHFSLIWKSN